MEETPDQETARLLQPYLADRDRLAHETLSALLSGRHEEAMATLQDYQLADLACRGAEEVCRWFDDGVEAEHITIEYTDQASENSE